jgi:RNA polymerase sigma-70 factor (ECF subfamily)
MAVVERTTGHAEETEVAEITDSDLVTKTRSGDQEAYGELVARYQGHVYGLAYSLVDNWAEAQDIAQEAFIRAYVNLEQLRQPERFAAWLRRVTFSVAMNWLKAFRPGLFEHLEGRVDLEALEIPDFVPGPPEVVERRELAEAVLGAVGSLPAKYRVPLAMFHLDGLSYQKVADFLDVPLGTAKSLIHRARAKLREALGAYAATELGPIVQEVFDEYKLPAEFAQRVLDNVPTLGWGTGRECTFAGALEAALAATDHPYTYTDILGFTGLAFRTRWFCGNEESRWCPSCAVGEMDEEIVAAERATGWPLRVHFLRGDDAANVEQATAEIVQSIDGGRAVLAYEPRLNMDVVYGYEQGGQVLLLRDYFKGEEPLRLPPSKLGFLVCFLGERGKAISRGEAIVTSLKTAVHNWRRERGRAGPGEYWYGKAALEHWASDIGEQAVLPHDDREQLCSVGWFNFTTMHDARKAAVTYLRDSAGALDRRDAGESLARAAELYAEEAEMLEAAFSDPNCFSESAERWTAEIAQREQDVLARAVEIEERAIAELDGALAHMGGD